VDRFQKRLYATSLIFTSKCENLIYWLERQEGLFLRPATALPVEVYTPERKAEFLLNNAVTPEDYRWAVQEVRKMGLDPDSIPHEKPE